MFIACSFLVKKIKIAIIKVTVNSNPVVIHLTRPLTKLKIVWQWSADCEETEFKTMTFIKVIASLIVIFIASSNVNAEQAKNDECFKVNVPTLNAAEAMNMLVEQTGVRLLFPYDLVRVHQAKAVRGCYTLEQAINIMLEGTGLVSGLSEEGLLMIWRKTKCSSSLLAM